MPQLAFLFFQGGRRERHKKDLSALGGREISPLLFFSTLPLQQGVANIQLQVCIL